MDTDLDLTATTDAEPGDAADLDALLDQVTASLDAEEPESPAAADSPSPDATASEADAETATAAPDDSTPDVAPEPEPVNPLQAELDRKDAELNRVQAQREREIEERRSAEETAAWQYTYNNGIQWWRERRAEIVAEAKNAYDPDAYLERALADYDEGKEAWLNEINANRAHALSQTAQAHKARNYANMLRDEHGFTKAEADDIVAFAAKYPQHVTNKVKDMIAAKDAKKAEIDPLVKRIRELELQIAAGKLATASPSPGNGRRAPKRTDNIDDYLTELGI